VLNDYPECFTYFSGCSYFYDNSVTYTEGQFYFVEATNGEKSCYRYEGLYRDCEGDITNPLTIESVTGDYSTCTGCTDIHFPLAQRFSACTPFDNSVLVPYVGGTAIQDYNGTDYTVPTQIFTVCDLQPMMNTGTTIVSSNSLLATNLYHFGLNNDYADAPWMVETAVAGGAGASEVTVWLWWQSNATSYTLSAQTECLLPDVLYSTGLTPTLRSVYSVELTDGSVQCMTFIDEVETDEPIYVETTITEFADCDVCLSACNPQDIVILMDQSGSINSSEWAILKQGVIEIANGVQGLMQLGEVRLSAIKWSDCDNTDLVIGLTSNYNDFVAAINNANDDGGFTYCSNAISNAYDLLAVDNLDATKSIISSSRGEEKGN